MKFPVILGGRKKWDNSRIEVTWGVLRGILWEKEQTTS